MCLSSGNGVVLTLGVRRFTQPDYQIIQAGENRAQQALAQVKLAPM